MTRNGWALWLLIVALAVVSLVVAQITNDGISSPFVESPVPEFENRSIANPQRTDTPSGSGGTSFPDESTVSRPSAVDTPRQQLSPADVAAAAFPSTVLLLLEDGNRQPIALGSGFFVDSAHVVTNFHVIKDAKSGYARIVGRDEQIEILGVTSVDASRDLALLSLDTTRGIPLVLEIELPPVGSTIFAVGNPEGLEGTFSSGIVSGIRTFEGDEFLQITAPISPGSSGGPVLNERAAVVGVATATFEGGQNLNFAVPAVYIQEVVSNSGEISPLSEVSGATPTPSYSSRLGNPATDGITVERFTWDGFSGHFSFSMTNHLRTTVSNVHLMLVFYDGAGNPIDFKVLRPAQAIPGGLAKRLQGNVHHSVQNLNSPGRTESMARTGSPTHMVEIRILDFRIDR